MSNLIPANAVEISGARLVTTSLMVAEVFGKQHKDVLRSIETIKADCPADFTERNFAPSHYIDPTGRALPMVELTKDGFTLLAMGYTGKKAMVFKIAYIDRFSAMEATLRQGAAPISAEGTVTIPVGKYQGLINGSFAAIFPFQPQPEEQP